MQQQLVWQENVKIGVSCAHFEDFMKLSHNDLDYMRFNIFDGGKKNLLQARCASDLIK